MSVSPFSLQHNWKLDWTIVPSSINIDPRVDIHSKRERLALEAIASVGVISKNQLMRLFSLREDQIKSMEYTFKILKHQLIKNKNTKTTIYTLNTKGALALGLENYKVNYWLEYFSDDVLKRLLFFQLYQFLPNLSVAPTPQPFVGAVENGGNMIYVYVSKGNTDDLLRYLKWDQTSGQRMMLVVENINQLKPLELYLSDLKIRIVVENDLMIEHEKGKNIFYTFKDGRLVR